MKTVTKTQFVQMMAEKLGKSKKETGDILEMTGEAITKILKSGDKLNWSGFGIFKVANRKARDGRNPKTGETIKIPASKKVRFTPSKALKETVA